MLEIAAKNSPFASVAGEGFGAPGVVVCYTDDPDISSGSKFVKIGMQIAAGVPLMCDEPEDYMAFRLGLFGLDVALLPTQGAFMVAWGIGFLSPFAPQGLGGIDPGGQNRIPTCQCFPEASLVYGRGQESPDRIAGCQSRHLRR